MLRAIALACTLCGLSCTTTREFFDRLQCHSCIVGPPYQEFVDRQRAQAAGTPHVQFIEFGKSEHGRILFALKMSEAAAARRGVLITQTMHGNEYLNLLERFPAYYRKNRAALPGWRRFLKAGNAIYLVPIMNPDGYAATSRSNGNWNDLNRDFNRLESVETRSLVEFIDETDLLTYVDYHCCSRGLVLPKIRNGDTSGARGAAIVRAFKGEFPSYYRVGNARQVLGYLAAGTATDYFFKRYKIPSFLFEGVRKTEVKRLERHMRWWDKVFGLDAWL